MEQPLDHEVHTEEEFRYLCDVAQSKLGSVFHTMLEYIDECSENEDILQKLIDKLIEIHGTMDIEENNVSLSDSISSLSSLSLNNLSNPNLNNISNSQTLGQTGKEVISRRKRRPGFSTESVDPSRKQFIPRVIHKTEEEMEQIREVISDNFLFSSLDPQQLNQVIQAMERKTYHQGDWIIRQGDEGDDSYVVAEGKCETFIRTPEGKETMVKVYERGGFFGELALMRNAKRAASIQAASPTVVLWALDRDTFRSVLTFTGSEKRLEYERFLSQVPLLTVLTDYERTKIVDVLEERTFSRGEDIIKAGDTNDQSFYILVEGEAVALKQLQPDDDTMTAVMSYSAGDYFGELALLQKTSRAATVRAETDCKVISISRSAFERLLGPVHALLENGKNRYSLREKQILSQQQ